MRPALPAIDAADITATTPEAQMMLSFNGKPLGYLDLALDLDIVAIQQRKSDIVSTSRNTASITNWTRRRQRREVADPVASQDDRRAFQLLIGRGASREHRPVPRQSVQA